MAKSTRHTAPTGLLTPPRAQEYMTGTDLVVNGDLRIQGDLEIAGQLGAGGIVGGPELWYVGVSVNFSTASTSFVTITGATKTFTVPEDPFRIYAAVPVNVEELGAFAEMRLFANAATQIDWQFARAGVAGQPFKLFMTARIPGPTWSPTPNTEATVVMQMRTTVASSDASMIVDFGGPFQLCEMQAVSCGGGS